MACGTRACWWWYCRYCEDQLLEVAVRYGLCLPPSARLSLEDMLASHLQKVGPAVAVLPRANLRGLRGPALHSAAHFARGGRMSLRAPPGMSCPADSQPLLPAPLPPPFHLQLPVGGGWEPAAVAAALQRYTAVVSLSAGQVLWKVGDPADDLYIIEKGAVRVSVLALHCMEVRRPAWHDRAGGVLAADTVCPQFVSGVALPACSTGPPPRLPCCCLINWLGLLAAG